ncbi:alpha/beta hydrolase [Actinomadura madurae]|uniref:alpha/beta hydrolase n=1 Tax=Actinomadura madurae TaxID=1993 RepID=UPI002026A955|nr:alpha/beta hydrolase [Actinomadura madurae]MCP9972742.1 alpha/beta hydrolase [Actinomadura madurae]MCP9985183.1 alpha/beta hydrolase [Actinomadura madurae]URN01401.1 alpha/beta hydrolase [Actinomadura madurae]
MDDWPGSGLTDEELDVAYNVRRKAGPELFERHMARYREMSEQAVEGLPGRRGLVYDEASGERLDVWGVGDEPRPVFVFLHGGYWMALSRDVSSFMARTLYEQGIATVVPDYTLAPAATLEEIVRQVRASIAWVHRHGREHGLDPRRIVVGGSSAGGHLTGMAMVGGWQAPLGLPEDVVKAAMPISGLFDIRPITRVYVNEHVRLDLERAAALSPALLPARYRCPAVVVAAEHDGDGFLAQSRLFHPRWDAGDLMIVPGRDHFDVVLDLADAASMPGKALIDLVRAV